MLDLKGKIAFVAGAGSVGPGWGNGKATAVLLARQGAKIFATDINEAAANETRDLVVKEGGDSVEVRSISGPATILEKADIAERQRRSQSMMPEGIAANIRPEDLAGLLAYLESTSAQ